MAFLTSLPEYVWGWITIPWRICREIYMFKYPPLEHDDFDTGSSTATGDKTIDKSELKHWTKLADKWWDSTGEMAVLRGFNSCRIPLIVETCQNGIAKQKPALGTLPLDGAKIIDVGCGAGFVSEPLAELGASVTAVDMVPEIIEVAKTHWKAYHGVHEIGPEYLCTSVEELAKSRAGMYDMLLCLEVVDHVGNMPEFVRQICKFVRPGGYAIFTTFNQTLMAMLVAIIAGEHLLRLVPMNTHHLYRFVKPKMLEDILRSEGFRVVKTSGYWLVNPYGNPPRWGEISYTGVTYGLVVIKE